MCRVREGVTYFPDLFPRQNRKGVELTLERNLVEDRWVEGGLRGRNTRLGGQ